MTGATAAAAAVATIVVPFILIVGIYARLNDQRWAIWRTHMRSNWPQFLGAATFLIVAHMGWANPRDTYADALKENAWTLIGTAIPLIAWWIWLRKHFPEYTLWTNEEVNLPQPINRSLWWALGAAVALVLAGRVLFSFS